LAAAIEEREPYDENRRVLLILGLALIAVFLIINYLVFSQITKQVDVSLFHLFNSWYGGGAFDAAMISSTLYGRELFWSGIILILCIFGKGKTRWIAVFLALTFLLLIMIGDSIKLVEFRPRPFETLSHVRILVAPDNDSSFPSGHALIVSAGATIAWLQTRKIYSIPMLVESILVSLSRVYVGVHYPMDVVAGWILGCSIACMITSQQGTIIQKCNCIVRKRKASLNLAGRSAVKLASIATILLFTFLIIDLIEDATLEGWAAMAPQLNSFSQAIVDGVIQTISGLGYHGIFALMFLESVSLPVPSEVILPFSGYLASKGILDFWVVLALTTLAGVGGAIVDYLIGYYLTEQESLTVRGYTLITRNQFRIAQQWFERYGSIAVFLSRMIPGFRTLISFPAGMARMNIVRFTLYTTTGCLIWNGTLIYAGSYLASNWSRIVVSTNYITIITTALLIASVGVFAWKRRRNKQSER
jgi:membrane protein DedA with SNARE-associated domain/membrane-associated phospholipid phosphatase